VITGRPLPFLVCKRHGRDVKTRREGSEMVGARLFSYQRGEPVRVSASDTAGGGNVEEMKRGSGMLSSGLRSRAKCCASFSCTTNR
jgi:hypothetical protein